MKSMCINPGAGKVVVHLFVILAVILLRICVKKTVQMLLGVAEVVVAAAAAAAAATMVPLAGVEVVVDVDNTKSKSSHYCHHDHVHHCHHR